MKLQNIQKEKEEITIDLSEEKIKFGNKNKIQKLKKFKKTMFAGRFRRYCYFFKKKSKQIQIYENKIKSAKPWIS